MHSREQIFNIIDDERDYQEKKYGPEHEEDHELYDFLVHMKHKLDDALNYDRWNSFEEHMLALDAVRKLTALGVATLQKFGYTRRYNT